MARRVAGHEGVSKTVPAPFLLHSSRQRLSGHSRNRRVGGEQQRVRSGRGTRREEVGDRSRGARGVGRARADRAPYAPPRFDARL